MMQVQGKRVVPCDWREFAQGMLRAVAMSIEEAQRLIAKARGKK